MFRLWFHKRESELIFTSSYEGGYLKAESSNKNTEYGGQVKPNIITVFDKKKVFRFRSKAPNKTALVQYSRTKKHL